MWRFKFKRLPEMQTRPRFTIRVEPQENQENNNMTTEQSRRDFEEWLTNRYNEVDLSKTSTGQYRFYPWQTAWEAWQAARERQWMPIETAPKDKIEILAWSKRHGVNVGILTHYKRPEMPSRKGGWFLPTHWMPLPNPPTSEKV